MVALGVVLLVLALLFSVKILLWIGLIFLLVGLVLNFGLVGPTDGTRRRYY